MWSDGTDANEVAIRYATFDELRASTPRFTKGEPGGVECGEDSVPPLAPPYKGGERPEASEHSAGFKAPGWLTRAEATELARYRDPVRREGWLLGRLVAKRLVIDHLAGDPLGLGSVEIRSRDAQWRAVRPTVRVQGTRLPCSLSISHSDSALLVALSTSTETAVGVDLAAVESLNPSVLVFWFTARERAGMRVHNPRRAALCWAVKEAVYKACNKGESFVPRQIEVYRSGAGRLGCLYHGTDLRDLCDIETWLVDGHVAAAATLGAAGRVHIEHVHAPARRRPARTRVRRRELIDTAARR